MKNSNVRKKVAFITTFALVLSSMGGLTTTIIPNVVGNNATDVYAVENVSITEANGYNEGAYVEWTGDVNCQYNVYYKADGGEYTQIDSMLIRQYADHFRADAVGLKAGTYTMKVVPVVDGKEGSAVETSTLTVSTYDRSGFAFSKNSPNEGEGVGAYNTDGTLKSGAIVVYVTEDTKNTVTAEINGTTLTGVANITQQAKKCSVPLCFRIIGTVTLDGLASGDMKSAYAVGVKDAKNITFEGIGEDATLYGAGVAAFKCNSVEVRNLGLMRWGGGKDGDGISLKESINVWIHDNDIYYGNSGSDSDQAKGDGSMDLKDNSQYVTISYNHFWDSGKMSLCGMKSESGENWITYHHNWFDHSDSRHPRIRTMSVHVYNNYYDGNAKYGVGTTLGSDAFVENNYFRNCNYPMLISQQGSDVLAEGIFSGETGGMIKSYGNVIEGGKSYITYQEDSTNFDAYEASSRDEKVPSTVKNVNGFDYNNFDTNSDIMYDYTVDKAEDVPNIVTSNAGRLGGGDIVFDFDDSVDDADYSVNATLMNLLKNYKSGVIAIGSGNFTSEIPDTPTTSQPTDTTTTPATSKTDKPTTDTPTPAGGQVHNFTTNGTESSYYTITGSLSKSKGSTTYDGLELTQCLKMESSTSVKFTTTADTTTLTLVTDSGSTGKSIKVDGQKYTVGEGGVTTITLPAGEHTITKGDSINLFYMATSGDGTTTETTTVTTVPTDPDSTETSSTSATTSVPNTNTDKIVKDAIYCSPEGTGDGSSKENPTNVLDAITQVQAGGTIYLLDGTYKFSETINIQEDNSGNEKAYKTIMAYPNANVVWDFSAMAVDGANRGVVLQGSYWHFKGFEITKAGDNGMLLAGDYNVIDQMIFNNNQDTGLQISRYNTKYTDIADWPSYNTILNCTSKNNCDDATMENADGFAAKLTCGEGNVFDGCMSYNNSDDGWDLFAKSETGPIGVVTIQNCIAFRNGYTEDGRGYGDCDGNGFKLGGSGVGSAHVVKNCLAFENLNCGFTDNNNPKLESITNCTSFNNSVGGNGKPNFSVYRCTDDGCDFASVISYNNANAKKPSNDKFVGTMENSVYYNSAKYYNVTDKTNIKNGDKIGDIVTLTDSDFISTEAPKMGEDFNTLWRNEDGSINVHGFMQLADSSTYKDLGSNLKDYEAVNPNLPELDYEEVTTTDTSKTGEDTTVTTVTSVTSDTVSGEDTTVTSITSDTVSGEDTTTASATETSNTGSSEDTTTASATETSNTGSGEDTTTTSATETSSTDPTGLVTGDVNLDGKVSTADLLALKKHLLGTSELSGDSLTTADTNKDGKVSTADLLALKKYLLGTIESFD